MARKKEQIENEKIDKNDKKKTSSKSTKNAKTVATETAKEENISGSEVQKKKEKKSKKKSTKKRKSLSFGPIEFAFDFVSIVLVICVGLYFGGRSFYYFSKQNMVKKETAMTLNGLILENNKLVKGDSEGFHQDEDGYFFKGNVTNNYVWFANRMFRVLRVSESNNVKLVSDDLVSSFMWGNSGDYASSNVRVWLSKIDDIEKSGVYYNTIPNQARFLADTEYYIDHFLGDQYESGDIAFKDKVSTITLGDYITAGGKNSFLNNGKLYFLLGYNELEENLYVEEDGSIANCGNYDGFGIRSVITLNKNIPVSQGDGTKDNPYMINQGDDVNYVDSYVKLGNDIWKVYEDSNGILKMYLDGYITVNGEEVLRNYAYRSNQFNFFDYNNIGSYLYNDYYNSLSYNQLLVDNNYPYGEMSDETGYSFLNIYSNYFTGRVSMLNLFDYVSSGNINDFFRCNTGARMSTSQYSVLANGMVEEAEVTDVKHIVPVVSIKSEIIKSGNGRIDKPYVVE